MSIFSIFLIRFTMFLTLFFFCDCPIKQFDFITRGYSQLTKMDGHRKKHFSFYKYIDLKFFVANDHFIRLKHATP